MGCGGCLARLPVIVAVVVLVGYVAHGNGYLAVILAVAAAFGYGYVRRLLAGDQ